MPADGDTLIFPSSAANKACVNNSVGLDVYKIEIQGTGYSLSGNKIGVLESIRINTAYLTVAYMYMEIELEADAQIRMMGYHNHLLCCGNINLASYDLRVGNYGLVRLYGIVSGNGSDSASVLTPPEWPRPIAFSVTVIFMIRLFVQIQS